MRRALLLAAGGVLTVTLASAAVAEVAPAEETDPLALRLLSDSAVAGRDSDYEGTQLVMLWQAERQLSASVRIAHRAGSGSLIQVEQTASTAGRTVFEPVSRGNSGMAGPSAGALELVRRNFVVRFDGAEDVLGRNVDVVLVRTRAGRPVQRLWIDRATALPLRRAFYDRAGRLAKQTAFVSLTERTPSFSTQQVATYPVGRAAGIDLAGLRRAGWQVPPAPDGMVGYDAVVTGTGDSAVLHLAYTDGIQTVSLFAQRGRLDSSALAGWQRTEVDGVPMWSSDGTPKRVVWAAAGRVYTVVTECDDRSVEQLVRSLPRGTCLAGCPIGCAVVRAGWHPG